MPQALRVPLSAPSAEVLVPVEPVAVRDYTAGLDARALQDRLAASLAGGAADSADWSLRRRLAVVVGVSGALWSVLILATWAALHG